jgi:hypothetical protein
MLHGERICPRIQSIRYYQNGAIESVEYREIYVPTQQVNAVLEHDHLFLYTQYQSTTGTPFMVCAFTGCYKVLNG